MAFDIFINPTSGRAGDTLTITLAAYSPGVTQFNTPYNSNVVTFNGVIADILEGTAEELKVIIPPSAISGGIIVETFTYGISNTYSFTVIFDDETFEERKKEPYVKGLINQKVRTLGYDDVGTAIYNRDLSYSNFVEIHDENSIIQNVFTIILTQKGERLFNPNFGTDLNALLFELIVDPEIFEDEIMKQIVSALELYEPRAGIIREQSFVIVSADGNYVNAVLALLVPSGSIREIGVTLKSVRNETSKASFEPV